MYSLLKILTELLWGPNGRLFQFFIRFLRKDILRKKVSATDTRIEERTKKQRHTADTTLEFQIINQLN